MPAKGRGTHTLRFVLIFLSLPVLGREANQFQKISMILRMWLHPVWEASLPTMLGPPHHHADPPTPLLF
jgi:hypothetical protein